MFNQHKLLKICEQERFNSETIEMLISSRNDIIKSLGMRHFIIPFAGEEVPMTSSFRTEIEDAIGASLIEGPAIFYSAKNNFLRLSAPVDLHPQIAAVLKQVASQKVAHNA